MLLCLQQTPSTLYIDLSLQLNRQPENKQLMSELKSFSYAVELFGCVAPFLSKFSLSLSLCLYSKHVFRCRLWPCANQRARSMQTNVLLHFRRVTKLTFSWNLGDIYILIICNAFIHKSRRLHSRFARCRFQLEQVSEFFLWQRRRRKRNHATDKKYLSICLSIYMETKIECVRKYVCTWMC